MVFVWITLGGAFVAAAWYLLRRRPIRCRLCSKRIRGDGRRTVYTVEGRRRVVCGRCDDANLRLTSTQHATST
jgi:hypothetical protein